MRKKFLIILLFFLPNCLFGCSADEEGGLAKDLIGRLSIGTERYLKDLKSDNILVRKKAIYCLGQKGVKRAVPVLLEFLKSDRPKSILLSSVVALGRIQETSATKELIGLLKRRDHEIRIAAICALGEIKDPKAIRPLSDLLPDKRLRLTVIWALGNIGQDSAIPALTELLGNDDKFVRYNAAQSLKAIGESK